MGYDLSYAEPTGKILAAKQRADEAYKAGEDGWYNLPRPDYYRYNIFGGGNMRGALAMCGLLTDAIDEPSFPAYDPDTMVEGSPEYERYVEACKAVTDADYGGVIPDFKLGSNDGWLVTPAEIQRGIDKGMVEAGLRRIEDSYDRAFVRWVIGSLKYGGFRTF